jgi:hypothetical protein
LNPYLSFGIAMCGVVGLSLFFTAYLAVMFNRRAKADLLATLTPLSELIEGSVDLENATTTGRYRGHLTEGKAANSPDGPGKVFYASIIDGAGGAAWVYTIRKPKTAESPIEMKFEGAGDATAAAIEAMVDEAARPMLTMPGWLRVEYDPAPGHVRLSRPMVTRRDIPSVEQFQRQLDLLVEIAASNRKLQQPKP